MTGSPMAAQIPKGGLVRSGDRKLQHVIESQQFTVPLLRELFDRSSGMERVVARGGSLDYQNRIMATLFYAPSTRTRFSFEAAMCRLGGRVLSAQVSPVPVVNAGDGDGGQHPTQALLDLYTIYRERPLNGLSVAIVGELDKGRTARSLAYLLAKFERVKLFFVSPPEMQMKPDILDYLEEHGVRYELESEIDRVLGEVDVVYQTRIRPERMRSVEGLKDYAIDSASMQRMKPEALILHPLPRTVELDKSVDDDPRALYFRQARNGLYVRMALLTMLLE